MVTLPANWYTFWVPLITGLASLGAGYLLWQLLKAGAFKKIEVKKAVLGPYLVLHKTVVGPYSNINKHFCAFKRQLHDMGLVHPGDTGTTTVGFFYDNPKNTPANRCRAALGFVFRQGPQLLTPEDVAKSRAWLQNLSVVQSGEMKVGLFPASRCLAVCHPLTGWLSILVAIMRVYPRLDRAFNNAIKEAKPGTVAQQLQGSLEVYLWSEGSFWVAYPLSQRTELLPFDIPPPAETGTKLKAQRCTRNGRVFYASGQ